MKPLLGFTLQLLKQYFELPSELKSELQDASENHAYAFFALSAVVAFSMLFGVLSLWSSIFSLVGRPPKKDSEHIHTVLFPFFKGSADEKDVCHKIISGMRDETIAKEYACQVWNVGLILQRKLRRNRWAAWMFLVQIALLTFGGILLLFCIGKP